MLTRLDIGPLAAFHAAGVVDVPDVHVANALLRIGGQPMDLPDLPIALAAALCVRALRAGSVCVDLAEGGAPWEPEDAVALPWPADWPDAVRGHPLVSVGAEGPVDRPLRLVGSLLYLQRYWADEQVIRTEIERRSAGVQLSVPDGADRQQLAADTAARRLITIVAGGPGTGKTTTVARIIAEMRAVHGPAVSVALAAPTGKAATRLAEAVGEPASTLHRLLGWRRDARGRFRHDRSNPLPHDAVIVDETSMVSLPLMARLLEAIRPDASLVLVGDPDQLASVEAGAVLADLVHGPGVVMLDRNFRFGGGISELAAAIRSGDPEAVLAVLGAGHGDVSFIADGEPDIRADVLQQHGAVLAAARAGDAGAALTALDRHRVLCAHRAGRYGVSRWNDLIASWTQAPADPWYVGRPLIVNGNDYSLGLFNGDTGVIVASEGDVRAAFARGSEQVLIPPARLDDVGTLHAMTVHRGQGSQFAAVSVVLPPPESPLLTRELLYTAVTRARERVRVVGTPDSVRAAVTRRVRRASGLSWAP